MCEEIFSLIDKITEKPKSDVDRFLLFCSMVIKISANGLHCEENPDYLISRIFNNVDVDNEEVKSLKGKFEDFIKADDFSPNKLKDFLESIKSNNESQSLIENHKVDILCFFAQMRAKRIFAQNVKSDKKALKKVDIETSDVKGNSGKEEDILISTLDANRTFNEYVAELAKILDDKFESDRNVINLEHILNEKFKVTDINNLTPDEQFLNFILSNNLTQESIARDPYNAALALKIPENLASETVLKIYIHVVNQFIKFGNTETLRNKIQKCCDKLLVLFSLKFNNSDELLEADKKLDKHCKNLYHQHLESILIYYLEKNKMEFEVFLSYINRLNDQGYHSVICKLLGNYDFNDILSFFCGNDNCIDPIFNYLNDHIFKFGFGDEFDINVYFDDEPSYKHEKHRTMMARANLLINSLKASEIGSVKRKKLNYLISCLMLQFEFDSNTFKADIDMFIYLFKLESNFFKYGVEFEEDVTDRLKQKLNRLVEAFLAQSVITGSFNNSELYNDSNSIYLKILECPAISDSIKEKISRVSNEFEHIVSHSQVLDSFQSLNASETDISNDCCSDIFKLYLEELEHRQRVFRRSYFPEDTKKKIIENLSREKDTFQTYYNQQKENFKTNLLKQNSLTEKDLEKEYCRDYNDKSSALQYEEYKLDKKMSSFANWVNGLIGDNKWVALLLLLVALTGIGFIVLYSWYRLWKLLAKRKYQEIDEQYKQYDELAQRESVIERIKDDIDGFDRHYFFDCCIELDKLIDLCQTTGIPAPPCNIFVKDKNREENNSAMEDESKIVQDLMCIEEDEVSTNEANNLSKEQVQELVRQAKEKFNTEVKLRQQQFSGDINKAKGNSNLIKMIYKKSKRLSYSFIKKRSEQDAQIDEEAKEILDYKKLEDYFYYEDSDFAGDADKQIEREKISKGEIPVEWQQLMLKYIEHDDKEAITAKAEDGKDQLDYYGGPLNYYKRFLEEKTKDIRFINIYEDESLSTHIGAARGDSNCLLYSLLAQMSQNDFDSVVKCVDENNEVYKSVKELIDNYISLEGHELDSSCDNFCDAVDSYMNASDETKKYRLWEHAKYLRIYIVIQLIKQDLLFALPKEIAESHKNSELKEIIERIQINSDSRNVELKLTRDKIESWSNILGNNVKETVKKDVMAEPEDTFGYVYGTEPIAQIISDLTKRPVFFYNGSYSNNEEEMGYIYAVPDSNNVYNLESGEVFVSAIKDVSKGIINSYSKVKEKMENVNQAVKKVLTDKTENPDKITVVIHYGNHFEPFGCDEYKDPERYGNLIIKHGTQKDLENKQSEKNKKGKDEVSQSKNKITVNINLPTIETPLNNISNVLNPIDVNHKSHEILKTPKRIKKKQKKSIGEGTTTEISPKLNFKSNTMSANHYETNEKNKKNKINKYQKQIPIQDDNKEEGAILT